MVGFKLKVITPTRVFYEGKVNMVEFNTTNGRIGIYAKHIPMTCIISPGQLIIHEDSEEKVAALISGFCEVLEEQVTIMAEICEWPDEIDEERAKEAKIRAKRRLENPDSGIDVLRAEIALKRALVRIDTKNRG